jgi:predicted transcriptional regulator
MKTWIDVLVEQHSEFETPTSFWFWSGLCTLSAVVKDNIYLDRGGFYNLYPNIYVILHAESGLKKGPPIALAKELVRKVNNTKIISGRSSIQGIMKKLSEAKTSPGGKINAKSTGFIVSSELSSSLVEDNAALTILTDLYDRHYNKDDWESLLKMETFTLKDPTVSLLGGINDAHAEQFFQKKDIQGGFLARSFVVYERQENVINSLARRASNPPDKELLIKYLKEVATVNGKFKDFSDENNNLTPVGRFYDDWYNDFRATVKSSGAKDDTGTLNRFGDSILKIAMLLSLSRNCSLEIEIKDLERAIEYGEKLVGNIRQTTMGRGMSANSPLRAMIMQELLNRDPPQISRTILMKKMYMHYNNIEELNDILTVLSEAGFLKSTNIGKEVIYEIPSTAYKQIMEYMKGKNK